MSYKILVIIWKVWSLLSLHGVPLSLLYGLAVLRVHVLNVGRAAAVNAREGGSLPCV